MRIIRKEEVLYLASSKREADRFLRDLTAPYRDNFVKIRNNFEGFAINNHGLQLRNTGEALPAGFDAAAVICSILPAGATLATFIPLNQTKAAMEALLERKGVTVAFHNSAPEQTNDDRLDIIFKSGLSALRKTTREGRTGWTHLGVCSVPSIHRYVTTQSTQDSIKISYDDNILGEYLPKSNTIHLWFDSQFGSAMDKAITYIINNIGDALKPGSKSREENLARAKKNRIINILSGDNERSIQALRTQIERTRRDSAEHLKNFEKSLKNVQNLEMQFIKAKENSNTEAEIAREYERLKSIDKVEFVSVDRNYLVVYTNEIICTNPKSKTRHLIGRCKIMFDPSSPQAVNVKNLDRRVGYHDHPHIQNTRPCMGNFGEILRPLMENGHFAAAVGAVLSYLETCNPEDQWGATIVNWPVI